jgi:metal-responsive CopG/Arc/MetJ family transcriptional regulator
MKIKTSITITDAVLTELDKASNGNRSDFIEKAIIEYIAKARRRIRDKKDVLIINKSAHQLNSEAKDVLDYQVAL